MTKLEFVLALKDRLSQIPQSEVAERLNFYCEMIEDRVEEGVSEQEAVASVGSVEEIAAQILGEVPVVKPVQSPKHKKRPPVWIIVLLALGCPVWLSLLIAAAAVALSLYAATWSVIASLWAAFGALVASAVGVLFGAAVLAFSGNGLTAAAMLGTALVCAGVSVFMFVLCRVVTDGAVLLTKKITCWIKKRFAEKEEA